MIRAINYRPQVTIIPPRYSHILESVFKTQIIDKKAENTESSVYITIQEKIGYLQDIYVFKNPTEIIRFLLSNPDLIDILISAPEHILSVFGTAPIYLELHHDYEADWDELFIVIKTNLPPEKAVELEDELFEGWFDKILNKVNTRLNFIEEPL